MALDKTVGLILGGIGSSSDAVGRYKGCGRQGLKTGREKVGSRLG
jgi:hypothetical protein